MASSPPPSLNRVVEVLQRIALSTSESDEIRQCFSAYQDDFAKLFLKVGTHARDRGELDPFLRSRLEESWRSAFPNSDFPKLPRKREPVTIFPGTSLEDLVKMIDGNVDDKQNIQICLKYLQGLLDDNIKPAKLKSSKMLECLEKLSASLNEGPVKVLCESLLLRSRKLVSDAIAQEAVRKAKEERQKARLEQIEKPSAAQKRAIEKLTSTSTSTDTIPNAKGKAAVGKSPSSKAAVGKHPVSSAVTGSKQGAVHGSGSKSESANGSNVSRKRVHNSDSHPAKPRPRLSQQAWERQFMKRAQSTNIDREEEELFSAWVGRKEDAEARAERI